MQVGGYFRGSTAFGPLFAPNQGARDAFILTLRVPRIPRLAITPAGPDWMLTWTLDADGYALEATGDLGPGARWSRRGLDPGILNDRYGLTVPRTPTNRYFRLRPFESP